MGAKKVRVEFVDGSGQPVAGVKVKATGCGELEMADEPGQGCAAGDGAGVRVDQDQFIGVTDGDGDPPGHRVDDDALRGASDRDLAAGQACGRRRSLLGFGGRRQGGRVGPGSFGGHSGWEQTGGGGRRGRGGRRRRGRLVAARDQQDADGGGDGTHVEAIPAPGPSVAVRR